MRRINTCIAKRNEDKKSVWLTSSAENAKPIRWLMSVCRRSQHRRMWIVECIAAATHAIESAAKTYCLSFFSTIFCVCVVSHSMPFGLRFICIFSLFSVCVLTIFIVETDDDNGGIGHASLRRDGPRNTEKTTTKAALQQHRRTKQMLAIYTIEQHPNLAIFTDNS